MSAPAGEVWDLAVIGAGPAGATLAGRAADAGLRVALLERSRFPREKLCGEFLSPEARHYLADLGLAGAVRDAGAAEIVELGVGVRGHRLLRRELPAAGLGLGRARLDEMLARWAAARGAALFEAHRVCEVRRAGPLAELRVSARGETRLVRARAVADASGLGRARSFPGSPGGGEFLAFAVHLSGVSREEHAAVELYPFEGGYCGIAPVENGRANLCLISTHARTNRLARERGIRTLVGLAARENPHLRERLTHFAPDGDLPRAMRRERAAPPPALPGSPPAEPPAAGIASSPAPLRVGDAAAMIAPACGDGISMAMRSAELAAAALSAWMKSNRPWEACLEEYAERTRREFDARLRAGGKLHRVIASPRLAAAAVELARAVPLAGWWFRRTRDWRRIA